MNKKHKELENLIQRLTKKLNQWNKLNDKFSIYRLITFLTGIASILIMFFFVSDTASIVCALIFGSGFIYLLIRHNKLINAIKRLEKWIYLRETNLARININWEKIPKFTLPNSTQPTPLESDLNISGKNSLLQLLNVAFSTKGKITLRNLFINQQKNRDEILKRQKIIQELLGLSRFRNRLLLTTHLSFGIENYESQLFNLIEEEKPPQKFNFYLNILFINSTLTIVLFILELLGVFAGVWIYSIIIYLVLYYSGWQKIKTINSTADLIYDDIRKYSPVFRFITKQNFSNTPNLKNLITPLIDQKNSPSMFLDKITFTLEVLSLRKNPFIWFFLAVLFPIDYVIASKLEKFKKSVKNYLPEWLECFHQLEAYISIANFAELNPDYSFPTIEKNTEKPIFECSYLGHPLIPNSHKVQNDFSIYNENKISIITGSNMSGKSTFLRTVGLNTVMAYAGCVVDSKKMNLSLLDLFSCIKVSDSVTDGISYFYAEVKRLKTLIDDTKNNDRTILFLIDEIYKGTNNVERIKGSEALLNYLSPLNVIGLVSTHDLELVKLEDKLPNAKNYHFKEIIKDEKMYFDYILHQGPCPTTNALKIMEIEGLPI